MVKKMFKKVAAILLMVILVVLTACGNTTATKSKTEMVATATKSQSQSQPSTQSKPVAEITTAKGFTEALLLNAGYNLPKYDEAKRLGLVPPEVKNPNTVLTRAQASYIIWNAINKIDKLKAQNIPVSTAVYDLWDSYLSGKDVVMNPGYSTFGAYQMFDFLRYEIYYPDGSQEVKYIFNPIRFNGNRKLYTIDDVRDLIRTFKKKYPNKLVVELPKRPNIIVIKNAVKTVSGHRKNPKTFKPEYVTLKLKGDAYYVLFERNKLPYANSFYILDNGQRTPYKPVLLLYTGWVDEKNAVIESYLKEFMSTDEKAIKEIDHYIRPKLDLRYNRYIYEWVKSLPRRWKYEDWRRFEERGYIEDYKAIPKLYREPVLHMLDLGIYVWDTSPFYLQKFRAKPGKTLTESEAKQFLTRLFSKSKRDVFDEYTGPVQLYFTKNGDVICGGANIGNVDNYTKIDYTKTAYIGRNGAIFSTPTVTLRLNPALVDELKFRKYDAENNKKQAWFTQPYLVWGVYQDSLSSAGVVGLAHINDLLSNIAIYEGVYFSFEPGPLFYEHARLPLGIYNDPSQYLLAPRLTAVSHRVPDAYQKRAMDDGKYYYNLKNKALIPNKPGVLVQYGDVYAYRYAFNPD
ncbi:hypothetical protein [Caldicellulosiruptor morganii]|uniref:Uncharacterized protein n=1 Tax=Caldicellulosiruptor morganii TaxID=1387555 RepID=A0ABY7BMZ8_9FIRM|nr:hypothetical protein [Caldicellulosiruptor morganii]WAM33793.1 hypothetical protein OTK00_002336 [Caldicellulosiruptor morganii]